MTDYLQRSWDSFSPQMAGVYLRSHGAPSLKSKQLLLEILKNLSNGRRLSVLDLGCGNAHLHEYFVKEGIPISYTGVDYSNVLANAARESCPQDRFFKVIQDDVSQLGLVEGRFDVAIYSHVIEMLSSPEQSLHQAARLASSIIIRFFEPPEFEFDQVDLEWMETGGAVPVPYIRRKMSRDYYRLILSKIGCKRVDIYRTREDKDQVHHLRFE
jgi:ubiquinone/menaquinone biosynthesis C-methylase UbiE